ncbi:hypothetical protein LCGC14_2068070 [marine sediment metagenome]|uniref:Uncharacterized protein n=1 Tax=marine sediment metagenome TaxID=412755 RepID=A0A0F9GXP6_9ZZZZ
MIIWKRTYIIFGKPFTLSIDKVKSWGSQLLHFGIHFAIALISPEFSLGGALFIEVRDGEHGHLEEWKEGFNIFPDFVFRVGGVIAAILARDILQITWSIL